MPQVYRGGPENNQRHGGRIAVPSHPKRFPVPRPGGLRLSLRSPGATDRVPTRFFA